MEAQFDSYLVKPKNVSSSVWDFFGLRAVNGVIKDRSTAICRLCHTCLRSHGSTSSLINHLAAKHPPEYATMDFKRKTVTRRCEEMVPVKRANTTSVLDQDLSADSILTLIEPMTMKEEPMFIDDSEMLRQACHSNASSVHPDEHEVAPSASKPTQLSAKHQKSLTDKFCKVMIKFFLPSDFVADPDVIQLFHSLQPTFTIPDKTFLKDSYIPLQHSTVRNDIKIQEIFASADVSISTDVWTAVNNHTYCAFYLHMINIKWQLLQRMLDVIDIESDDSAESLLEKVRLLLDEWDLDEGRVVSVTTSGSEILHEAVRVWNKVDIPCLADTINVAVKTTFLESHGQVINKCLTVGKILFHFNSLHQRSTNLWKLHDILLSKKVTASHDSHWTSILTLLQFVREHVQQLNEAFASLSFSADDERQIEEVISVMEPLAEMTDALVRDNVVTSSAIKPFLFLVEKKFGSNAETISSQVANVKMNIVNCLKKAYSEDSVLNEYLLLCSILDPRFKELKYLDEDQRILTHSLLKDKMYKISSSKNEDPQEKKVEKHEDSTSSFSRLFAAACEQPETRSDTSDSFTKSEFFSYLNMETAPGLDNDPLQWWSDREKVYPILSELAPRYLCIPASSKTSERAVKGGHTTGGQRRVCLSTNESQMLYFLSENIDLL